MVVCLNDEDLDNIDAAPSTWWKNSELVSFREFARSRLGILATNIAAERENSLAGKVYTNLRNRLGVEKVNMLLRIKSWTQQGFQI